MNISEHQQTEQDLYGSIDLGTNTCRLLIAKLIPTEDGRVFSPVESLSRVVRFGENLDSGQTGTRRLSPQAVDRALMALEECKKLLQRYNVRHMRCVATAACRYAENTEEFVQEALNKTGIRVEVISPQEESELAVAGCAELFDEQFSHAIVFDIGGGSTEFVWTEILPDQGFRIVDSISFPYGFATSKEDLRDADKCLKITQSVSSAVNDFAVEYKIRELFHAGKVQMIGASGTITTLAAIAMDLDRYDKKSVHEVPLCRETLKYVFRYLSNTKYKERVEHPCIGQQRAESIMGGVALFKAIDEVLNIDPIIAADRGVREGILHTLARQNEQKSMGMKNTSTPTEHSTQQS